MRVAAPKLTAVSLALALVVALAACGSDGGLEVPLAGPVQAALQDPTALPRAATATSDAAPAAARAVAVAAAAADRPRPAGGARPAPGGDEAAPGTAVDPAAAPAAAPALAANPADGPAASADDPDDPDAPPPGRPAGAAVEADAPQGDRHAGDEPGADAPAASPPSPSAGRRAGPDAGKPSQAQRDRAKRRAAAAQAAQRRKAARKKPGPRRAASRVRAPARKPTPEPSAVPLPPGKDATDLYYEGKRALEARRYSAAIASLRASQQLRPSGRTLTLLGRTYFDAGRLKDAERALRRAGNRADALLLLATLYQQQGNSSRARRAYKALLTHHPDHPRADWVRRLLKTL